MRQPFSREVAVRNFRLGPLRFQDFARPGGQTRHIQRVTRRARLISCALR